MTTIHEAAQQALEALKLAYAGIDAITVHGKAITALEQRLAQPVQEHVIDCPRCGHCCPQQPVQETMYDACEECNYDCNQGRNCPRRK